MRVNKKRGLCDLCNIYGEECNGTTLYVPAKTSNKVKELTTCANLTESPCAIENSLQVQGFYMFYKRKRKQGMASDMAFAEAIEWTSDEVWAKAETNRLTKIKEYKNKGYRIRMGT